MRVISGSLGGRRFGSPPGHKTHPMSDKIRGALFNVLGDIRGLTVLDPFAGSGAISFEAISRGALHATAIDVDRLAQRTISENIQALHLGSKTKLIQANAASWLSTTDEQFDLVICDPPYDEVKPRFLEDLARRTVADGLVVFSLPPDNTVALPEEFELLSRKEYGDATLSFYRRVA